MSMFQDGLNWLCDKLLETASVTISVYRNGETILETTQAVPERSWFNNTYQGGKRVENFTVDFVFPSSIGYIPKKGDRIIYNGETYVVKPVDQEVFRYDDVYKTFIRVYVQKEGGVRV